MSKQTRARLALIPAALMASMGSAFAAVPADVTTELTTAKTDVMAVGALVFAIAIGIILFKWFRRAL